MIRIALIGNPNSGKTTLFNALTGGHQRVGNWPGVTVERKSGTFHHGTSDFELVDLPGIYNLLSTDAGDALDEQIARNFLLTADIDAVINVVDASSLTRGLFLTSQLLELDIPVVLALNMMDVADRHGVHLDPYRLSTSLGCPVAPMVASRREGLGILKDVLSNSIDQPTVQTGLRLPDLEGAIAKTIEALEHAGVTRHLRFHAAALLDGDVQAFARVSAAAPPEVDVDIGSDSLSIARYNSIDQLLKGTMRTTPVRRTVTDMIDAVVLNRWLAFPVFLAVIYLMFMFTINVGSAFIDLFDLSAKALFVEVPRQLLQAAGLYDWLVVFLADGVGGGFQLVATFIPVIGCLFLFLSFLEDSGYMGRAAFIVDRLMRQLGLPGKSFVPLIVGFGCNVPAVMATRTLDNQQDRILTTIMAPYMSCGARLTVYALFAVAFFPNNGQNLVFGLYFLGIAVAVVSALLVRRYLMSGDVSTFVMELPAYHLPTVRGLLLHTWHRLKGFVLRAGKAIVTVVVVLNVVSSVGTDGSFGNQDTEKSALSAVGKALTPIFSPMGIEPHNWPATVGIFTGIFAKEVVVGTLDALYSGPPAEPDPEFDLWSSLAAAWATVPVNLAVLSEQLTDPLGLDLGDLSDSAAQAADQDVATSTLDAMRAGFATDLAAFSYLVFILLYIPCVATIGVVYKELGGFWATFSTAWSLIMAYTLAVLCFQIGSAIGAPEGVLRDSLAMIGYMVAVQVIGFSLLIRWGRRYAKPPELIPLTNIG